MIEKGEISSNFPLIPIKTASLHLPALRPKHAVLEHHVFEQTFSFTPENWQDGVKRTVLNELGELKQSEK